MNEKTKFHKVTRRSVLTGSTALMLAACSSERKLVDPPLVDFGLTDAPTQNRMTKAPILFVTDRARGSDGSYGADRAREVSFGEASVGIGENETTWDELVSQGSAASPSRFPLRLMGLQNYGQLGGTPLPFRVSNGQPEDVPEARAAYVAAQSDLSAMINRRLKASNTGDVILHVPGVNTGFEDGIFATTDVWHHSGRKAVPIVYSWPSGSGGVFGYFTDRESGEFTIFHLKEFLRLLYQNPNVKRIHLLAHSRGADIATSALRELLIETRAKGLNPRKVFKIENLILAAPDLNFDIVGQRLVSERFGAAFGRITVYINRGDSALSVAQRLMDGVRLGRLLPSEVPETERVIFGNVAKVNFVRIAKAGGLVGHSYFRQNPVVLSDIILLIKTCAAPGTPARPLEQLSGNFWLLPENYLSKGVDLSRACSG